MSNFPEPTKVDTAASDACTRSGSFALLLSTALFLLIPYWLQRPNEMALRRYIGLRTDLALQVDTLDASPIWQTYKASHQKADLTPISQLIDLNVDVTFSSPGVIKAPPNAASSDDRQIQNVIPPSRGKPQPPSAPVITGFAAEATVPMKLSNASIIQDRLIQLDDAELLSRSRRIWNFYNISIARWGQKRNDLIYRNVLTTSCWTDELEVPNTTKDTDYFVPTINQNALLKCLTVGDARELAHFESPTLSDPTQPQGRVQSEVQVNPGTLPKDLLAASIVAQMLLFFVIVHFAAYAREAVLSPQFPASGTLFAAFSRSRVILAVLLAAFWTPFVASIAIAITSRNWVLVLCSVLICGAVFLAYLALQRKSYFGNLNLRLLGLAVGNRTKTAQIRDSSTTPKGT